MFVSDGYDKGIKILRAQHDEDCNKVAKDIFAHYYITGRNILAIKLIVSRFEKRNNNRMNTCK